MTTVPLSVFILSAWLATFVSTTPGPISGNTIHWIDVEPSSIIGLGVDPAGFENHFLYLCRIHHVDRYIVGKLHTHSENRLICECHDKEKGAVFSYKFQMLATPQGTTSWVSSSEQNFPAHAIPGGNFTSGEVSSVCRAFHGSASIITGDYSRKDGKCHFTSSLKHISEDSFEILVMNGLGAARGVRIA